MELSRSSIREQLSSCSLCFFQIGAQTWQELSRAGLCWCSRRSHSHAWPIAARHTLALCLLQNHSHTSYNPSKTIPKHLMSCPYCLRERVPNYSTSAKPCLYQNGIAPSRAWRTRCPWPSSRDATRALPGPHCAP